VRISDAVTIGAREIVVVAGPCAVEGHDMLHDTALAVQRLGASLLRGGAYKPRTSPHSFQGLGAEALEILSEVRTVTGLPVVSEVVDPRQVEQMAAAVDVLQVGARNMQNFALLAEVGRARVPVLLKRGLSATVRELLHASEHVRVWGNEQVILCERGIRTFEPSTRNTLDVAAVPVLKAESHLPVLVDPSHAAGRAALVTPLALAAVAAGADGLLVEVHPAPGAALSDGEQSLDFAAFAELMLRLAPVAAAVGRTLRAPLSAATSAAALTPARELGRAHPGRAAAARSA
jgi:3-deoxy-7-phosphoheptulonate synthase